jgi:hypothetical protein
MIMNAAVLVVFAADAAFPTHFVNNGTDLHPVKLIFVDLGVREEDVFMSEKKVVPPLGGTISPLP